MLDVFLNSRRDFLRIGALSTLGLSLPLFLRQQANAASEHKNKTRAKSVILVYLGGGLSHHDSFDLKPERPPRFAASTNPSTPTCPACASAKCCRAWRR